MNKSLIVLLLSFCFFTHLNAITINIPSDYSTIQAGIDASTNGDTVLVSKGKYKELLNYGGKLIVVKSKLGPLVTTIENDFPEDIIVFNNNENSQAVIEGFLIHGGRIGVLCRNASPTIKNNIFYKQNPKTDFEDIRDWAAISLGGATYASLGNSPATIINNTITNCGNGGISSYSTVAPTIKNNIVAHNAAYGIHMVSNGAYPIISHNAVYRNAYDDYSGASNNYINISNPGTGAIVNAPKLNSNFTINGFSPCIDRGDPNPIYNSPDGTRNDIGAVSVSSIYPPRTGTTLLVPSVYPLIQYAIDVALDGDTVIVGPGRYNEAICYNGKNIHLKSVNGPLTTILEKPEAKLLVSFDYTETADAILEGFHLEGSDFAIECRTSSPTIKNNLLTNQNSVAIYLRGKQFIRGQSHATMINNTILNCEGTAIINLSYTSPTIKNTLIAFCSTGISSSQQFSLNPPPIMSYNNVYSNITNWENRDYLGFSPTGDGLISIDPLLNQNYTLQELSPCIDAGDPNAQYNDPDDSRNDIGAVSHYIITGDLNNDGGIDISDLVMMVNYQFNGGIAPEPVELADFNSDGSVDISDLVALVAYMFGG